MSWAFWLDESGLMTMIRTVVRIVTLMTRDDGYGEVDDALNISMAGGDGMVECVQARCPIALSHIGDNI